MVASDTRGLWFKTSHWQKIYIEQLLIVNCIEKTKINKKRSGMAHFLKNIHSISSQSTLTRSWTTKSSGRSRRSRRSAARTWPRPGSTRSSRRSMRTLTSAIWDQYYKTLFWPYFTQSHKLRLHLIKQLIFYNLDN